jgi:DNA-binding winged helix-turn-helix (wHTH) protein/tetratricopeptide (TPR) repeat protein
VYARAVAVRAFGVFELDDVAGELRRQGRLVHLTGQPLKALCLLVARNGTLVTRDELRKHIWDDGRFVDFERNLNFCIAQVREALGDSARGARFIETVPRRGYRFIADVRSIRDESARHGLLATRRWFWAAVIPLLLLQAPPENPAHTRETTTAAARAALEQGFADLRGGRDGRRRSVSRFREAIRLDPRLAEAHYALASAYLDLAGERELPAAPALSQARGAALRAVALEDVSDTRTVLGVVRLLNDWDWRGARREFVRSLSLEPNADSTLAAYARYLSAAGEPRLAMETIDRAEAISPSCDLALWESAMVRYRAGRPLEALAKARAVLEHANHDWTTKVAWLSLLIHADREEWTLAAGEARTLGARIDEGSREAVLAFVRFAADRSATALGPERRPVWTATLYAAAADAEAALDWLEQAATEHDPDVPFSLRDPVFDRLRASERYQRLVTAVGVPAGRRSDSARQLLVIEHPGRRMRPAEDARDDLIAQRQAAVAVGEIDKAAPGRQ